MYHSPNLRIEQVSEDSELDLTEQHHASLPYSPPERQRRELPLPHYPSWDADWRSGGVSDDHAFITGPPPERLYEDWLPDSSFELSPPETIKKPRRSDKERRGDGGGGVVDERTKQKRIKMLEQEFGAKPTDDPKYQKREKARQKREEKSQPGYVDRKLRITTQGRLKRAALRWIEALLALAAVLGSIGVLFVGPSRLFSIKLMGVKLTKPKDKPPPQGALPSLILYALAPITFLCVLWLFVFGPCCAPSSHRQPRNNLHGLEGIIPVLSGGSNAYARVDKDRGCLGCCGGSRKKDQREQQQQGMHISLIVDPTMFPARMAPVAPQLEPQRKKKKRKSRKSPEQEDSSSSAESDTSSDSDQSIASSFHIPIASDAEKDPRSFSLSNQLDRFAQRERKAKARRRLVRIALFDGVFCLLWLVIAVWAIGFGKKCPAGTFNGWCDGYNSALAAGALMSVSFGTSCVLDWRDLRSLSDDLLPV